MVKEIGSRELQLRELGRLTRLGKNERAGNRAATLETLKKAVARVPAKKVKKAKKKAKKR